MSSPTTTSIVASIVGSVKRLLGLYVENVRLKATEKVTILLAAIAFYGVIMAMGLVCLVFVSIGIGHLLATTLAPHMAYLIVAAFYFILFVICIAMRRRLFIDPIAHFMSRLLVEMPAEEREANCRTVLGNGYNGPGGGKPGPTTPPTPVTPVVPKPEPKPVDEDIDVLVEEIPEDPSADMDDDIDEEIIIKYPDDHDAH